MSDAFEKWEKLEYGPGTSENSPEHGMRKKTWNAALAHAQEREKQAIATARLDTLDELTCQIAVVVHRLRSQGATAPKEGGRK